jgi:hypothetical protein
MDLLTVNNVSAGLIGYIFAMEFVHTKPMNQAIQSIVVSAVARMLSDSESSWTSMIKTLNTNQKNELIVAALSAACSSVQHRSVSKGSLAGVSIDLIGEAAVKLLNMNDTSLFTIPITSAATQNRNPLQTGPNTI